MKQRFIKFAKLFAVFLAFISAFIPFINGLGCNFSFYYEDDRILNHGVCRAGVLDIVITSKVSGSIVRERVLWGVLGDAFYGYIMARESVREANQIDSRTALFESTNFLAGKYAFIDKRSLATYIKHPVEMVRLNHINGRLAFFNADDTGLMMSN